MRTLAAAFVVSCALAAPTQVAPHAGVMSSRHSRTASERAEYAKRKHAATRQLAFHGGGSSSPGRGVEIGVAIVLLLLVALVILAA